MCIRDRYSPSSLDKCRLSTKVATNPQPKPTDLDCESTRKKWQLPSTSTIAILLLLSPRADTHYTVPRRVEGWVDLGTAVRVCSPCPRLYIEVAVVINTTARGPRWDSNLGPLTLQSGMLPLCHCNTWPSQQSREELTDTSYNSIAQEQRCMLVTYTCKQSQCLKLFEFDSIGIDRFLCQFQHAAPGFQSQLGHFTLADKHNIGNKWLDSFINKTCN